MTHSERTRGGRARPGFTVLEISAALGILTVAMVLVGQVAAWSLGARARDTARRDALEVATNVLESARARPWNDLTPRWAAAQRLPDDLARLLDHGRLTVRVEPEDSRPFTKRVTVEIGWKSAEGVQIVPVRLVSLFSDRSAPVSGRKP